MVRQYTESKYDWKDEKAILLIEGKELNTPGFFQSYCFRFVICDSFNSIAVFLRIQV
jgi:hypothetical protein